MSPMPADTSSADANAWPDAEASGASAPTVIVLAAGAGTRMKSRTPKVLHEIGGLPLLGHALVAARGVQPARLAVVVRHERELVAAAAAELDPETLIVDQDEVPGTGSAVRAAVRAFSEARAGQLEGTVLVSYADVPLLSAELLTELVAAHERDTNAVTVLTAQVPDPTGYGRVLRSADGSVTGIREHKDASAEELAIQEISSGIYAFDAVVLSEALGQLTTDNAQGELYLTDVLGIAAAAGGRVAAMRTDDIWQVEGANDRVQLAALGAELNRRTLEKWMRAGVTVVDPQSTWVDTRVRLAEDVTLLPGVQLHGESAVERDAVIGPDCTLSDVQVGEGATVTRTHGTEAIIAAGAKVGPYSYLRAGTVLGEAGKIGAFYETKNVRIGARSKLSHLGYAGDADIGEDSNIGCGNITANYDGEKKHRTVIGSGVRTGSNTVFVAPVVVGDGAYSGAGAVIRKDVPPGALTLSVAAQRNLPGWVTEHRSGSVSAEAAQAALAQQDASDQTRDQSPESLEDPAETEESQR